MRKKLLYVLLGVVLASNVLTACGKSNSSDNDKDSAQEESQTEAVVKEDEFQQITMGSYIDLGFAHFTFNKASRSQEIRHPYRGGFYYPDIPGESYILLEGSVKNTGSQSIDIKNMSINIVFDDDQTFSNCHIVGDDGVGGFNGTVLNPYISTNYYVYASVPDEILEKNKNCKIQMGLNDNYGECMADDLMDCTYKLEYKLKLS